MVELLKKHIPGPTEVGRVNDSILEYNGNIGVVTISIEYTKVFTGGDKNYMPNACKSVVRVKNTNECYRTSDGRVVGMYYSSLSILKQFNFIPNICSIYQELLEEDENADCSEKLDLGSEISTDVIEYVTKLVGNGTHLGVDYLINPITGSTPGISFKASRIVLRKNKFLLGI